ncbi:MAG: hypothetical protein ACFB15_25900 [Cyclobacteriaceae bacterium]
MSKQRFVITSDNLFMILEVSVTEKETEAIVKHCAYEGNARAFAAMMGIIDYHVCHAAITRQMEGTSGKPYTEEFDGLTISSGVSKMEAEVEV